MDLAYSVGFGLCFGYSDPRKKWCSGGIIFIQNFNSFECVFVYPYKNKDANFTISWDDFFKIVMGSTESWPE